MENEIWKDAIIHHDLYQVSSLGNVRNKKTSTLKAKSKINSGYDSIVFSKNRVPRNYLVHRLVWETFNSRRLSRTEQVNHINKNKQDNSVINLEMVCQSENIRHFHHGRKRGVQWTPHGWMAIFAYLGKREFLGRFNDKEEAYEAFKKRYFEFHGSLPW